MTKIYHNPRCRKSRETLQLLQENNETIEVIHYLETPPSIGTLTEIIRLLKIRPIELVRTNESLWKETFKGTQYSDEELIEIMVNNPKLIERPIVIKNNRAALGRPPGNVKEIL